ncbi:unnamed protein product [Lymnaea stagnalis]|uniref:Uncharacterized protein n=1 Tax=Lymnaea stagnalis TaxID=6523 RepID=A0AAV2HTZ6_LYMST
MGPMGSSETVSKHFVYIDKSKCVRCSEGLSFKNNNSVDDDDDSNDGTYETDTVNTTLNVGEQVTLNQRCVVKSLLAGIVTLTAITLIVIVSAANRDHKGGEARKPLKLVSSGQTAGGDQRITLRHQFLIRDVAGTGHSQVMSLDDDKMMYVIEDTESKYYNSYIVVDFTEEKETFLIVAKSKNEFGTDIQETLVLFCETSQFDRAFHGTFAQASNILKVAEFEGVHKGSKVKFVSSYIGAPATLGRFLSLVVNGSCENLTKRYLFSWENLDESLACGAKIVMNTELGKCPQDLCGLFAGNPLSRGLACNKFRSCNYVMGACNPFYIHKPRNIQTRPFCVCRRTASADAGRLECPETEDDGGECEIPKRDLLISQSNLACLCFYQILVAYPYLSEGAGVPGDDSREGRELVQWMMRDDLVTGPAITYSQCPC